MNRRAFLQTLGGAAALSAAQSSPAPAILLGIDTYSIRSLGWKAGQMLDYAESRNLDVIQISHGNFESIEPAYVKGLKDRAERSGIQIEPGFGCISPLSKGYNAKRQGDPAKYLEEAIRVTRLFGAHSFKVFIGNGADRAGDIPIPGLMETAVKAIRAVRAQALDAGVKIAIENHGDLEARQVKAVIEAAGPDVAGSNYDSGNPTMLAEDPLQALEVLAPYVVTSHFRDSAVYEHPRGAMVQWTALGDGSVDLKLLARRFRELCPRAYFQLEIITGSPARLVPYLDSDWWKRSPDRPAADFARFVALAKTGHPLTGSMLIAPAGKAPPAYQAAMNEQQRYDLDRSLEYARRELDMGVRWRNAKDASHG